MKKLFLSLICLALFSTLSYGQQFSNLSMEVPFNSAIRKGVLPNGLTYYIMHNETPKGSASFYIYQNVGAVLETDQQDGLAHFLEHMAFNGTITYPGKSMLNMLEYNGVKFGRDVNAYTAKNETVYNISRVPTKQESLIDSCLLILRDWCDGLSLTTEEIDAERGVISEEWRMRRTASFKAQNKLAPTIFNNTIYAERDVIGELDVIKNFDPKEIKSFYHEWYRTDLQAIAVVGDIDVDAVESKIKELFTEIQAIENPKERKFIVIPDNKEPMFAQATDPEFKNVSINLKIRHKKESANTLNDLRKSYINSFFNNLIGARFREIQQKGSTPYLSASVNLRPLQRGYGSFDVFATAERGKETEAFEAAYTELERVLRYGFTEAELERLKTNMLVGIENQYNKRNLTNTESYCKALKSAYLDNISVPDAEFQYNFAKEIIPGITPEEVSDVALEYLTDINRAYIITGPEGEEGETLISQKEIEDIIAKVEQAELEPYVDDVPEDASLLSITPTPGKIVAEKKLEEFDAIEWTLSNGAKVLYKFEDYQTKTVVLNAFSYGGSSLYEVEDLPSFGAASDFVSKLGIGKHNPIQLKKVTTGKTASCSYKLSELGESISAFSAMNNTETMLQMVHMRFEEPRFNKEDFDELMDRSYKNLKSKAKNASSIMQDTLSFIISNNNPRFMKVNEEYLGKIDYERMTEIYKERFSNAADFTFFIVGDIEAEELKPLVEKYIASIRSNDNIEEWVDNGDYYPKGKKTYRIPLKMEEPKATVQLRMRAKAKYSRETVIYHSILGSILNLRYTESIREKEGGTYGVSVNANASRIPEMRLSMSISFDCDPQKADRLKELVYKELVLVQKDVQQSDLDKVVLNMKKNYEQRVEDNRFWLSTLKAYYYDQENQLDPDYYETIVNNVTAKDIEKAAKRFMKNADVLDFIFLPETE